MIKVHKIIATVFGIGCIGKGGGTIAAVVYCLLLFFIPLKFVTHFSTAATTLITITAGVWSGNVVDLYWGKDSSKVVIDEVAGMMVTMLFIPVTLKTIITGLVLFRFFDIAKPLLIRKLELLPKGWGVMADDILAGVYANLILYLLVIYKIL